MIEQAANTNMTPKTIARRTKNENPASTYTNKIQIRLLWKHLFI